MIFFGIVPLLLGAVLAVVAPAATTRLTPRAAATTLTALCLIVALATGAVLAMLAMLGVALAFPDLSPTDWSVHILRADAPFPAAAGLAAAVVVTVLAANAVGHAVRVAVDARAAYRASALLPSVGDLAVVEDDSSYAYAVPGRPGRVVASTALLRALSGGQRRALLAHERSHLRHRHYAYAQLARLAAAANPLLRPVARTVDVALERWADADAAAEVGDPRLVAHAIGVASLQGRLPVAALGAGGDAVVERVRLLLDPPQVQRRWSWLLMALGLACCIGAGTAALGVHFVVEAAESLH